MNSKKEIEEALPSISQPSDPETVRDWEPLQQNVDDRTERLRISGGWLYRTVFQNSVAMVFVKGE